MRHPTILAGTVLALFLTGCSSPPPTANEIDGLVFNPMAHSILRPGDVPVPAGFRAVSPALGGRAVGRMRSYKGSFEGNVSGYAVQAFYDDRMPRHGWSAGPGMGWSDGLSAVRTFRKSRRGVPEEVRVSVRQDGYRVHLDVQLYPLEAPIAFGQ